MRIISLHQIAMLTDKLYTDDFFFSQYTKEKPLVICSPADVVCYSPCVLHSRRSLEEHIQLIHDQNIKHVMVIAENIDFLRECPEVEWLQLIPALTADNFDISPIYEMPNLKYFNCSTTYGEEEKKCLEIDCSKISQLESVYASGRRKGFLFRNASNLKIVRLSDGQPFVENLGEAFAGTSIEKLYMTSAPIRTLNGIENFKLETLEIARCKRLTDISSLAACADTLKKLEIDSCGKITDFRVIQELKNLEYLVLMGSQTIPDVSFIQKLPKLKAVDFRMNIADGDTSHFFGLDFVRLRNRKHYNHKDEEFQKNFPPEYSCLHKNE